MSHSTDVAGRGAAHRARLGTYLTAIFFANLGGGMLVFSASYVALLQTGSIWSAAFVFLAAVIPQIGVSVSTAALADKYDKKLTLILAYSVSVSIIALFIILGGGSGAGLWTIYAATFALALLESVYTPVGNALLANIATRAETNRASAQFETATQAGALLSVAAGGVIAEIGGPTAMFLVGGICFMIAALGVALTPVDRSKVSQPQLRQGCEASIVDLLRFGYLFAISRVVVTVNNVLLFFLVIHVQANGMAVLGFVDALGGLGVLIASLTFVWLAKRVTMRAIAVWGYLGCAVAILLQPHGNTSWLMALFFLGAVTFGQGRIAARAVLLNSAADAAVGRAFGISNAVGLAFSAFAMVGVTWLITSFSIYVAYAFLASSLGLAAILGLVLKLNCQETCLEQK